MYNEDIIINKNAKLKYNKEFIEVGTNKRTLVNCLLGANDYNSYITELEKIAMIQTLSKQPDIITDLSIKRRSVNDSLWNMVVKETPFIAATLPIYSVTRDKDRLDINELLEIIIEQMENGVGMMTIHPTANKKIFNLAKKRMIPVTSRGGGMVIRDLIATNFEKDNIYIRLLPQIINYAKKHGVVLSIGATFRSANIFDSCDSAQLEEVKIQNEIANEIYSNGVGVILESPGHAIPKDILKISTILKKSGFPIMPLGPIPTEISIGMDHISAAIGGAIMGIDGCANIISTVTREEHTGGIPSLESTIESIITAKIVAHIIDIHRINDTLEDKTIADTRSKSHTCVMGKESMYCDRCNELCPLSIY